MLRPTSSIDAYSEEEFVADLMRVTGGRTDEALARRVVRDSAGCPAWIRRSACASSRRCEERCISDRTNVFFLGGGKALMNSYYAAAERRGIRVLYDAQVVGLDFADGTIPISARPRTAGPPVTVTAQGGRPRVGRLRIESRVVEGDSGVTPPTTSLSAARRTTPGTVLKPMLDQGAQPVGDPTQCHAVAIDARAPKFDGGIVTRLDCVPLGIVVNLRAERFYDEGEDLWPKRYAIWGRLVAQQPGQIAYSIIDAKVDRPVHAVGLSTADRASTMRGTRALLDLSPEALERDRHAVQSRAVRAGTFDHQLLDDCRTEGLTPAKTHWAQPIDTPPFWGYPLRPGITFTYLGLKVDERARVLMTTASRPATSSRPARSWPATFSARATSPASA